MNLYFEKISLRSFFSSYFRKILKEKDKHGLKTIYYLDLNPKLKKVISLLSKLRGYQIEPVNFKMIDVRDKSGELIRLRLPRKDIFELYENIKETDLYKSLIKDEPFLWKLRTFIDSGIMEGNIMDEKSPLRLLYIINVVDQHMKDSKYEKSYFILNSIRPWQNIYENFAIKKNIDLIFRKDLFSILKENLNPYSYRSRSPKFYLLLKYLKYKKKNFLEKRINRNEDYLYVEGRGDVNLVNDGRNSDFFWQMNSSFPKENILYLYEGHEEKIKLRQNDYLPILGSPLFSDLIKTRKRTPFPKTPSYSLVEYKQIRNLVKKYNSHFLYWTSFFSKYNTKIFLTWYRYDNSHIVKGDAIRSLGGISAVWQIAFCGYPNFEDQIISDIFFSYSRASLEIDKKINSQYKYNVITGYPKDYAKELVRPRAQKLKSKIQSNGASFIVSVLDENSVDDSRWHTGHELQKENYFYILEELLNNQELGVIFKPKTAKTLRSRLGKSISNMLDASIATGRCYVFEESGRHTTLAVPLEAALASDLCIHSHFCAGSSGLEAALAGIPTLLLDRETTVDSLLNNLPRGEVVFNSWPEIINAIKPYYLSSIKNLSLEGHWKDFLEEMDPFNDGLGASRLGNFLNSLLRGFKQGLNREECMAKAAEEYSKKWGSDKIIENFGN